jgi:hypothetical protein
LNYRRSENGTQEYLVKWKSLPIFESTWETKATLTNFNIPAMEANFKYIEEQVAIAATSAAAKNSPAAPQKNTGTTPAAPKANVVATTLPTAMLLLL